MPAPTPTADLLLETLARRVVVLDGAMGTMFQGLGLTEADYVGDRFRDHPVSVAGCPELLQLIRPDVVEAVHYDFLRAGADIIETNTFGANTYNLGEYQLQGLVRETNLAAVAVARRAADRAMAEDGRPRWVAGSIGPTNKTASLSPDVNDPGFRAARFADLVAVYREQAEALLEGGVDLLLPETTFDTLNLKAALFAFSELFAAGARRVPVIASVTITDRSGRTLSGQTLEAFYNSVSHADLTAVSINCALGGDDMRPYVGELSGLTGLYTACYPNAGLPNEFGGYDDTPDKMGRLLGEFAQSGWVNLVGGCCGSTPAHIAAIARAVDGLTPRRPARPAPVTRLSGLEPLTITPESNFTVIGERTNVTGSAAFRRLIKDGKYDEALTVARQQVEGGANILDVCMDEGMLDGEAAMTRFLDLIAAEPDIARIPVMVDSSRFSIIEAGLRCLQGKGVVNSISLKEGEAEFRRQAAIIRRYGAAVVVMAFDETGQATDVAQRVAIARRAYRILTEELGFAPADLIFDPNILTIGTGMEEHDGYAVSFLEATRQIKAACPGMKVSGGVSNLSFSFRTNPRVREAMHAVFLYHAIRAGLDMAIVNAGQLGVYEELDPVLRDHVEDLILNRRPDATERLLALAATLSGEVDRKTDELAWRKEPLARRMAHALVIGNADFIDADVAEALTVYPRPLAIIEGPLMDGMNTVGELFGAGKMFLPQVVKSARVMKKAVALLEPLMEAERAAAAAAGQEATAVGKGTMVIATVKGDVHDIGKNIVGVVLRCNGYVVHDLGVMVPAHKILDAALEHKADLIGLSGLITPSLDEMIGVAKEMERRGLRVPLLIGGATTSGKHTAVKIAPAYGGPTVHVGDASLAVGVAGKLLGDGAARDGFVAEIAAKQVQQREQHARATGRPLLSLDEARRRRAVLEFTAATVPAPSFVGVRHDTLDLATLAEWIDWSPFFHTWELSGRYPALLDDPKKGDAARKVFADGQALLARILREGLLQARASWGFFPAARDGEDLVLFTDESRAHERVRMPMLRQQEELETCRSLADFVADRGAGPADHVGGFIVTAGLGCDELVAAFDRDHDDYHAIMTKALADRLAEAGAEYLHKQARDAWGYGASEGLTRAQMLHEDYRGIRPAFGYPACPDHGPKRALFALLGGADHHHVHLTEGLAMTPTASVSGLYFAHPEARYFAVGRVGREQVEDYARRAGVSVTEVERMIPSNLAY
ncbi:MAG: methionine synthase [Kofleriaceae bacterium]|jgi:5-methyltetrahydrofolate--homocysteine methyltransferase|nr:methionine synthase [Kofleriaceae bacterium]MBP6840336.1 methionine synthase [Kofleriaceae bacterium]MBP9204388.1 methionine synthase [Kofleriaceae bacterium]